MKTRTLYTWLAAIAMLGSVVVSPAASQKLDPGDLESLIQSAQSKEDHLKIAGHYSSVADDLEAQSKNHERMAEQFGRRSLPPKVADHNRTMVRHCKNLARSLAEASREARQMAAAHTAMAEESAK